MHASAFQTTALPTKLEAAKLTYDLAVEEAAQKKIVQEIAVLDREISNERARYQNRNRGVVKSESQLLTGSRTYTMLKRQKETLQREQQSSLERLTDLSAKQLISASPIDSATKAFKGISKKNPMRRGRKYVPVVPASVKSPLENLGGAFQGLAQPFPEAEAMPLGVLPKAVQAGAKIFATAQTRGAGKMVKKAIQNERWTAMANATEFDVKQKIAELKVKHPDNPNMWSEKAARIDIGNDAANTTEDLINAERSGSLFPGVPTPKVAFTGATKGDANIALKAAAQESTAIEKLAKLAGQKIKPGRRGSGQFYSEELVNLKKMAATGTGVGVASAVPIQAAYGDVYQATQDTPKQDTSKIADAVGRVVDPDSSLAQAYEASGMSNLGKTPPLQEPMSYEEGLEKQLAAVKARGEGGAAVGTLYKEGVLEDFYLGMEDVGSDMLQSAASFTAGASYDEQPIPPSRGSIWQLAESAFTQGYVYAFEPEKFAKWEKEKGHPLDMAIEIASNKSIMRLAGEASVEAAIMIGTAGIGKVAYGGLKGIQLARQGVKLVAGPMSKFGAKTLIGPSTKEAQKHGLDIWIKTGIGKYGLGRGKGKAMSSIVPKHGFEKKLISPLDEAVRIQAGGWKRGAKMGVRQGLESWKVDPFGLGMGTPIGKMRLGQKILHSKFVSSSPKLKRSMEYLTKIKTDYTRKVPKRLQQDYLNLTGRAVPGYSLPHVGKFSVFGGRGSAIARGTEFEKKAIAHAAQLATKRKTQKITQSITKSRGIKGIPRMDVDSIAPLYKAKPKPRKPAHLKKNIPKVNSEPKTALKSLVIGGRTYQGTAKQVAEARKIIKGLSAKEKAALIKNQPKGPGVTQGGLIRKAQQRKQKQRGYLGSIANVYGTDLKRLGKLARRHPKTTAFGIGAAGYFAWLKAQQGK
ncbi:MAG: hypothetical protein CL489_05135 [Acidobacteria bacterium]|nr:hypothetical protein [Acidobacteriota bacterium]